MAKKSPFRTNEQIKKEYAEAYKAYADEQTRQANRLKTEKNTLYDGKQREGYTTYMENKKALPEELAKLGVVGGATESTTLRGQTNYENVRGAIEKQRGSDLTAIDNQKSDNLSAYNLTAQQNMRTEMQQERAKELAWLQAEQEKEERRFANTIRGWNSVSAIDSEIARIQRSGVDLWKIPYLKMQRTDVLEAEALARANASSGGGGGYSYGGGGSSSGGGSAATQAVKAHYKDVLSKIKSTPHTVSYGKKKKSSSSKKKSTGTGTHYIRGGKKIKW